MMATVMASRPRRTLTKTKSSAQLSGSGVPSSNVAYPSISNPLVQVGYESSRHLIPERLPSARRERTVGMRVIEMSEETILNIMMAAHSLKRLDMSGLKLTEIPHEITEELKELERFDVSSNLLSNESFPSNMKYLLKMHEFEAHHNNITHLPKSISRLKNLSRLKLANNKLASVEGIEKLKKLTMLVLDDNEIETLTRDLLMQMKKLEILHLSRNKLKEITGDIRLLRHMTHLDIADNHLSYLPAEVFTLPKLEALNASNNHIARLPTIVVKGKQRNRLSTIDLSGNVISKFPEHLLLMTDKLDLSKNKIKTIPGKTIKKMNWRTDQELCLDDNPLTNPPPDICECGMRSIIQYFQEAKAEMKVYQGLKMLVVGQYRCGKTSLIQSLVDMQARLCDEEDRTVGTDLYETALDLDGEGANTRQLPLTIWDFSGNPEYMFPHYFFLQQPALTLLVFNMSEYKPDDFENVIGRWIDWIIAKNNKLIILPVGTHTDKMRKKQITEVCQDVSMKISAHMKNHIMTIEQEIRSIESRPHISSAFSEQLKAYISLLKIESNVYKKVIGFSAANIAGLPDLQEAIISMSNNKKIFPNIMRAIPSLWTEVENYVDEKGYGMQLPMILWENFVGEITKRFGMKHLIEQITKYLHEVGRVIWFHNHPTLRDWVILRPTWLMDLVKALFRRDIQHIDVTTQEDTLKQYGVTLPKFEQMREEYKTDGILHRDLIKFMWHTQIPPELNKSFLEVIRFIVQHFEIGYVVDRPSKDGWIRVLSRGMRREFAEDDESRVEEDVSNSLYDDTRSEVSSIKNSNSLVPSKFTRILVPWLRETSLPKAFKEEYERFVAFPTLVANFRFPTHIPAGFFETLCTRAATRHNLDTLFHWRGGLYARHTEIPMCRVYILRIAHEDGSTCIRTELRHEISSEESEIENLWTVLLPYLKDVDTLCAMFAGGKVERNMECPHCHALSFMGEWHTPKELQNVNTRTCENCRRDVSTAFLVQPKEKKKVEEFLRQRLASSDKQSNEEDIISTAPPNGNSSATAP